jgi:uncharacterized membrane protein YfcA
MDVSFVELISLSCLGIVTGFAAGLLGLGGGLILVPFLTFMLEQHGVAPELTVKMAIATAMATIVFTSVASVSAHHKRGNVRWDIVRSLSPGLVIGSWIASMGLFSHIKGAYLGLFFSAFIAFSAYQMFLDKRPAPTREFPKTFMRWIAGLAIGVLSGLVGAGGGFISVPFMLFCNIPLLNAVATSAALGFPIALANVLGYTVSGWSVENLPAHSMGYIWLPALVLIAMFSSTTARFGVRAAQTWPVKRLKRVFASLLVFLAAYMIYKSFTI